jgi:hypothetical protein
MTTAVDDAKAVLAGLETKLSAAKILAARTVDDAKAVSFPAHTGEAAARKKLDELNKQGIAVGLEIQSLEVAVSIARGKLADARADADDGVARDHARRALALLDDFAKRGDELQQALDRFVAKYGDLTNDFKLLEAIGYPPTNYPLIRVNMRAAMLTALMVSDLKVEHLAPNERRGFRDVIEGWANNVRGRASARLSKEAPKAA